jgi:3-dehydroquinate synthase
VYHQRFTVAYDYPVHFTQALFAPDNPVFSTVLGRLEPEQRQRFVVFVDAGVVTHWPDLAAAVARYAEQHCSQLELLAGPEVIPGGEQAKQDMALVTRLQQRLLELGLDRHACVVAIGGGAFLDIIGYVAATTHRGLRHVRVPTTVLAQNDSGVGVKNGINAFGVKNLLGTFTPPFAVLNDADFLRTLPPRERASGIAEALKVALIRDAVFFEWLESRATGLCSGDPAVMGHMIRHCAELHMQQIAQGGDPFESGSARPLDYGHWAAHKLEVLSNHALRHGEAVAIGIALDCRYSVTSGLLAAGLDERLCRLLRQLGFHLWHPALEQRDSEGRWLLLDGLREFREHLGGVLTVTLLRDIGCGVEVHHMDQALIQDAVAWLRDCEPAQ